MTMYMPAPLKTRLQNIPQFFRENRDEHLAKKEQEADTRRSRMTVSGNLELNPDWNGRNTRTQNMVQVKAVQVHRKREAILTREGINMKAGYGIVVVLACILAIVLLVDLGGIGYTNRQIRRTESKIENYRRDNERTESELAEKKGDTQLISQAVQLNMVSSGSNVIVLHAPTNANLIFDMTGNTQMNSESLAMIQGD